MAFPKKANIWPIILLYLRIYTETKFLSSFFLSYWDVLSWFKCHIKYSLVAVKVLLSFYEHNYNLVLAVQIQLQKNKLLYIFLHSQFFRQKFFYSYFKWNYVCLFLWLFAKSWRWRYHYQLMRTYSMQPKTGEVN